MLVSGMSYYDGQRWLAGGAILIATGLFLRHQMLKRAQETPPQPPIPRTETATLRPIVADAPSPPAPAEEPKVRDSERPSPSETSLSMPRDTKSVIALGMKVRPLEGLWYALRFWIAATVLMSIVQLVAFGAALPAIIAASSGASISPFQRDVLEFLGQYGTGIDSITTIIFWITAFLYCRFVYRGLKNLRTMNIPGNETTPVMGVVWNFVPLASFIIPYMVMTEIWRTSHTAAGRSTKIPSTFGFWWLFWVLSAVSRAVGGILEQVLNRQSAFDLNLYNFQMGALAISASTSILSALALFGVIRGITRAHDEARTLHLRHFESLNPVGAQPDKSHSQTIIA